MRLFIPALLLVMVSCSTGTKKDYYLKVKTVHTDSFSERDTASLSDQGVQIEVKWKARKAAVAKATLFDGANNPVWNQEFPNFFEGEESTLFSGQDSVLTMFGYTFNYADKPGTWKFALKVDDKDVVSHSFPVAPARQDAYAYASVECISGDGKINLSNFYQLSGGEREMIELTVNTEFDLLPTIKYQLQKRATLCIAPDNSLQTLDSWEHYFEKLSGMRLRQEKPTVHQRISEVMPAYEDEFLHVNKDFIEWAMTNMVPDPKASQMNGVVYQTIYDRMFQDKVRNLALVGLYYFSLPNDALDAQVDYARVGATRRMSDGNLVEREDWVDMMGYLIDNFEGNCNEWMRYNVAKNERGETPMAFDPIDMGFWIRRGIDGSANQLWLALGQVLKQYDKAWYERYIDNR